MVKWLDAQARPGDGRGQLPQEELPPQFITIGKREANQGLPGFFQRINGVAVSVVAIIGVLLVVEEDVLLEIDEPLYFDWLEAGGGVDRWTPSWVNVLGQPEWAIPISIAIGIVLLRHRFVAIAYPAVIVIAGVGSLIVSRATHRLRPPFSGHAGEYTSFPSGHSIQVTLLLGMLPLAAFILTGRRWVAITVAIGAFGAWMAAWADVWRTGGHWPSDQIAGFLVAVALLAVVYGLAWRDIGSERDATDRNAGREEHP